MKTRAPLLPSVIHIMLVLGLVAGSPRALSCQATFKVATTTTTAEKGHSFDITLDVRADRDIKQLTIRASAPENFSIRATGLNSLEGITSTPEGLVAIGAMKAGSSVSILYRVQTPGQVAVIDWILRKPRSLDTTRDPKVFAFNASFVAEGDSAPPGPRYWSDKLEVKYTTSRAIFLVASLLGLLLGFAAKLFLTRADAFTARARSAGGWRKLATPVAFVFLENPAALLTTLLIGTIGLLVAVKDGIPVGGWGAALAMGAGLGLLSDDALLKKVSGPR